MYTIEYNKKGIELNNQFFSIAVENVLREHAHTILEPFKTTGSLIDLNKGVFGLNSQLYEAESQGVVLYQKFNILGGYFAMVHLLGFDENSCKFKDIKEKLEEIAQTEDPEIIKSKFFDKKSVTTKTS